MELAQATKISVHTYRIQKEGCTTGTTVTGILELFIPIKNLDHWLDDLDDFVNSMLNLNLLGIVQRAPNYFTARVHFGIDYCAPNKQVPRSFPHITGACFKFFNDQEDILSFKIKGYDSPRNATNPPLFFKVLWWYGYQYVYATVASPNLKATKLQLNNGDIPLSTNYGIVLLPTLVHILVGSETAERMTRQPTSIPLRAAIMGIN